jgi:hypothetical protein
MTCYLCNFYLYQGKDEQRDPGYTATEWPIVKLTKPDKFQNKGHVLATDNWYTSIKLAIYCLMIGIYLIGTVKTNRDGLPKDGIFPRTGGGKRDRGQCEVRHQEVSYPDSNGVEQKRNLYFVSWMDNKPVHMLSTFDTCLDFCKRVAKVAKRFAGHIQLVIPTIIKIYNKVIGSTDGMDRQIVYYKPRFKSRRWPVRVFLHFVQICAFNAFVLYRQDKAPKLRFLKYTEKLMDKTRGFLS